MIHPRLPQHILAAHPFEADQNILQCVVECMAHMKRAGDIRRRNHDRERLGARLTAGASAERIRILPSLGNFRLDALGVIGLFEHGKQSGLVGRLAPV